MSVPEKTHWLFLRTKSPEGMEVPGLIACGSMIQRSTQSAFKRPLDRRKFGAVAVRSWADHPSRGTSGTARRGC